MTQVGAGRYRYELVKDFPRLPDAMTFGHVSAMATDSQDRLYVLQRKDPPVLVFDRVGTFLDAWGSKAIAHPHGITVADDIAYITDREDCVAVVFTLDGRPLQVIGKRGVHSDTGCEKAGALVPRAGGPFNYPTEMTPGLQDDYYITDGYRNCRVHRFARDGRLLQSWGEPGKEKGGQFHLPHSIVVTPDGKLYVADRGNQRVQIFTTDGQFIAMYTTGTGGPNHIARDREGVFYVCEQQEGKSMGAGYKAGAPGYVSVRDEHGNILARWASRAGHGMCVDSRGDIYIGMPGERAVDKYVRIR